MNKSIMRKSNPCQIRFRYFDKIGIDTYTYCYKVKQISKLNKSTKCKTTITQRVKYEEKIQDTFLSKSVRPDIQKSPRTYPSQAPDRNDVEDKKCGLSHFHLL